MLANVLLEISGAFPVFARFLLEEHAERCIKLAYQCQNKNAERFLRLLAVDLMLAAEQYRPGNAAVTNELAELDRLSRMAAASELRSESASTA